MNISLRPESYDDYDPDSAENAPDWTPDEEPPADWIGWALPDGPDDDS